MTESPNSNSSPLFASDYILDNFDATDRVAILVLNRQSRETIQRITTAKKAASPEFQAWLRFKNANGSDIYLGMNPLRQHAWTRTKDDIVAIRHVYLDLDHGGQDGLKSVEDSAATPPPNYVLTTSPGKYQVVWRVEEMSLEEAETLLHAIARKFDGDPAATDACRVLRLPGFANKKYASDFYVEARKLNEDIYQLRDFKLHLGTQDSPRHNYHERAKHASSPRVLSQSEYDWAFAKRALSRGEAPDEVVRQIASYRANDKHDPQDYATRTVTKAQAELRANEATRSTSSLSPSEIDRNQ